MPESGNDPAGSSAQKLELLIDFTKDDDARTRATAVAGLAKIADPRGFAPVLVALFDPVDEVRAAAATALGVFGDDRAYEPLVEALGDPNERVAVNCLWALGQIPTTRCLDKLLEVIADRGESAQMRAAAITAVGERSSLAGSDLATSDGLIERARVVLLNALEDESGDVRATSAWTLGHLPPDKQTTEACLELLEDEYEWAVRYAIEALAHFGDLAAVPRLEELADSDNEAIRDLAVKALDMLH